MGSSIGIAHGILKATSPAFAKATVSKEKVIALIGDSTFFHVGIPALVNTVYNKSDPLIIVLDNRITAMTGHQPNPGQEIKIEEVAKACGVKNIKVIDPINFQETENVIKEFLDKKEVSVVIMRRMCAYYARKIKKNEE